MRPLRTATTAGAATVTATLMLSGCGLTQSNQAAPGGNDTIEVTSSAKSCELTSAKAPSGNLVFTVKNTGNQVTEFYLYGHDGQRIVGEIENVGPGLSRQLVVAAAPGTYVTACKPGMVGAGIRDAFTVTDSGKSTAIKGVTPAAIAQATGLYQGFVKDQAGQLLPLAQQFVAAYESGDDAKARALYPKAREHYESIEPVAESFGDLDPETDLREADLEPGQKWTGWHRIEKDLWPPAKGYTQLTPVQRKYYGANLLTNITTLHTRVQKLTYSVDEISNGSKGLLDEVATSKITGEEDTWSHTDLWDLQANVDGARVGFETLQPLLQVKSPTLSTTIAARFTALQKLLDTYKGSDGFVFYDTVTPAQRKTLSDAVNALSEPLSQMTGAITL